MAQRILIYGNSIFLNGIAAQLRGRLDAQILHTLSLQALGNLATLDMVLVDLNDPLTADVFTLLRARPDLKVVGVNSATGALTVLGGEVYLTKSLDEMIAYLLHETL